MNILFVLLLWAIGWGCIALINSYSVSWHKKEDPDNPDLDYSDCRSFIVSDGRKLLLWGLIAFIGNLLASLLDNTVVHWLIFILLLASCLFPLYSFAKRLPKAIKIHSRRRGLTVLSGAIFFLVVFVLAFNVYFRFIY